MCRSASSPTKSCVNDKDADQTAHLQSGASIEGADLHAYHRDWRKQQRNRSVYSFAQSEGNDRCRSACSSMIFSVNNNSADQSAHMQNPESRSASSTAKSCANNDGADQPAHLRMLAQRRPDEQVYVGPTSVSNVGPTESTTEKLRWPNVVMLSGSMLSDMMCIG